jgi:hypothetical protein
MSPRIDGRGEGKFRGQRWSFLYFYYLLKVKHLTVDGTTLSASIVEVGIRGYAFGSRSAVETDRFLPSMPVPINTAVAEMPSTTIAIRCVVQVSSKQGPLLILDAAAMRPSIFPHKPVAAPNSYLSCQAAHHP